MNALIEKTQEFAPLAGRILISTIFILAGAQKITAYEGTAGYMEAMGVPGFLLPLVILTELLCGLAILVGYQTRLMAFALAGFTLLSALIFHNNLADQTQFLYFFKNLAIAGGFLFLVAFGGGAWSVDNWRANKA